MKLSRDAIWHTTKAQKRERDVTRTNNLAQHKQVRERDEIGRDEKKKKKKWDIKNTQGAAWRGIFGWAPAIEI